MPGLTSTRSGCSTTTSSCGGPGGGPASTTTPTGCGGGTTTAARTPTRPSATHPVPTKQASSSAENPSLMNPPAREHISGPRQVGRHYTGARIGLTMGTGVYSTHLERGRGGQRPGRDHEVEPAEGDRHLRALRTVTSAPR